MRYIPEALKEEICAQLLHGFCLRRLALKDHICEGRITWEHALIYAGRQINEVWAIVELCAKAHSVDRFQDTGIMVKTISEWIAINRMSPEDEEKYPRFNWAQRRAYLNSLYGPLRLPKKRPIR